ncbi:hypothetical protein AVEN_123514-1 [Araneus ventricosus]|uniref:Mut7-C RNAse domain-containing protein n=1 Tax=Araneus ventricosus TaxID=182803 RepID=A0A4Y2GNG5_ARAVE|nr:hypothetical protein AVEN_123514-1 [Araneus ventricosus]
MNVGPYKILGQIRQRVDCLSVCIIAYLFSFETNSLRMPSGGNACAKKKGRSENLAVCNESNYIHVQDDVLLSLWTRFVGFDADMTTIGKKNATVYQCDVTAMNGYVHESVPVQLAAFTPKVFERVRHFFLCAGCGKVYWEGSHLSRVKKSMSKYVDVRSEDKSVYKSLLGELGSDDEETAQETTAAS